jgi:pimeloyl-ACP methyl ester carboxylesterase
MSRVALLIAFVGCFLPLTAGTPVAEVAASARSHYERPTSKSGPYKQRVIVFVHGLFGNAEDTWTNSQTHAYWPKLLLSDPRFNDSDIYVANYASPHFGNTMNVDEIAKSLESRLANDEVFQKHREVVFVCHSLGGLVVQQLLLLYREYAKQVPFIYFFSTPESGAKIARLGSLFSSDPLLKDTFEGDENEYLQIVEDSWKAADFQIHRLCAYEKKSFKGVLVVERLSGTRNCETALPINEDHLGIVKPDGFDHPSYVALRNAVKEYPIKPAPSTPKKGQHSPPTKDLDIVCQKLEECPPPELRKRAFLLIHRLEDLYSEYDKEYNRIVTQFGDDAHQGAREAMIRGIRVGVSSRYRSDYEPQVLEYRRVMIDRLPAGSADHRNDWFYGSQGPNWVMYSIIEHVNNIAEDLRQLASQLDEVKKRDYKIDGLKWLKDESLDDGDEVLEPEELATDAIEELENALIDLREIITMIEVEGPAK